MIDVLRPYFEPLGYLFGFFGSIASMPYAQLCLIVGGRLPLNISNIFTGNVVSFPAIRTIADTIISHLHSTSRFWGTVLTPIINVFKDFISNIGSLLAVCVPPFMLELPCIVSLAYVIIWLILSVKIIKVILSFIPFF